MARGDFSLRVLLSVGFILGVSLLQGTVLNRSLRKGPGFAGVSFVVAWTPTQGRPYKNKPPAAPLQSITRGCRDCCSIGHDESRPYNYVPVFRGIA